MRHGLCLAAARNIALIGGFFLTAMSFRLAAQTNQVIYADSLQNGWANWSWDATINLAGSGVVHGGSQAISITITKAWGALYLEHSDLNGNLYSNLTFWINGGSAGGQQVRVVGIAGGQTLGSVNLNPLPTNSWTQVTLSLASLGVGSSTNLDGLYIEDRLGAGQPAFYVDDITLISNSVPTIVLTAPAAGSVFSGPTNLSLAATVFPNGHTINKVQFYNGATLLNEDAASPYSFTWNNVAPGAYSLLARVVFDSTHTVDSASASVTVAGNLPVTITVDAAQNQHPISPGIYGVAFASAAQLAELNAPLNRSGGNAETRYNWQLNAHNRGGDWYFESIDDGNATAGASGDSLVSDSKSSGAEPLLTIPMIGWAPKLGANRGKLASYSIAKYGPQTDADKSWMPDAGNGKSATNNGASIIWNDPNDANIPVDSSYQRSWLQHLTNRWGCSTNGGVKYYLMDNEHSIWFQTHQDVHPTGPTMAEIRDKILDYARMVKALDPNALILGPEEWGWGGYIYSGYDQWYGGSHPDRAANGNQDYMPWLLSQLHQHDTNDHERLLDYFTLHCYPQSGEYGNDVSTSMQLTRNRSTRQLWDTTYVDPSWISSIVMLIPRMKAWVATNYPGTKIGITEYDWGAESHINGATAQADILGIFGREGLDLATRWTTPDASTLTFAAMKLYRNYDGNNSTFGDTSILAAAPNPDNVSAFAAARSSDGALTVVVINKQLTSGTALSLVLTNRLLKGAVQAWQLTSATNAIVRLSDLSLTGNVLNTTLPLQSITLFVLPPGALASPQIRSPQWSSSNTFSFWLDVTPNQRYVIQASTNLTFWVPVLTNTPSSNSWHVTIPASSAPRTFYRAQTSQ